MNIQMKSASEIAGEWFAENAALKSQVYIDGAFLVIDVSYPYDDDAGHDALR